MQNVITTKAEGYLKDREKQQIQPFGVSMITSLQNEKPRQEVIEALFEKAYSHDRPKQVL